jgi:predicted CopG family antitoxin
MPTIRIDDQVYEELKKLADPFQDAPNDVIRRVLMGKQFVLERFKKYLVDPKHRIDLHDLVTNETAVLSARLSDTEFPVSGIPFNKDQIIERLHQYESATETMREIIVTGCYWGEAEQAHYWTDAIKRIASPNTKSLGAERWFMLRLYPALLLLYSGGIASLARREPSYSIFEPLYSQVDVRLGQGPRPLVESLNALMILEDRFARELPGLAERQAVPMNQYLHGLLRQSFRGLLAEDTSYDECFNRFEYLVSLVHKDALNYYGSLPGRYMWSRWGKGVEQRVAEEARQQKEKWPPFQYRMFGGALERFEKLVKALWQSCSVESIN